MSYLFFKKKKQFYYHILGRHHRRLELRCSISCRTLALHIEQFHRPGRYYRNGCCHSSLSIRSPTVFRNNRHSRSHHLRRSNPSRCNGAALLLCVLCVCVCCVILILIFIIFLFFAVGKISAAENKLNSGFSTRNFFFLGGCTHTHTPRGTNIFYIFFTKALPA